MSQIRTPTPGGGSGPFVMTLTGNSGGPVPPTANNINVIGSGGVLVTGNPGTSTLVITVPGSVITSWIDEAINFPAEKGTGYFVTAECTGSLPPGAAQGDTIQFLLDASLTDVTPFVIQANAGQSIRIGENTSSVAGTASAFVQGNGATLVFRAVDSTWLAVSSSGTWSMA